MDATELGKLATAAWREEKVYVARVPPPPASGDSTLSGEGIADAEGSDGTRAERRRAAGQRGGDGWRWQGRGGGCWWSLRLGLDTGGDNGVPMFPDPDRGNTGSSVKVLEQWPQEGVYFWPYSCDAPTCFGLAS